MATGNPNLENYAAKKAQLATERARDAARGGQFGKQSGVAMKTARMRTAEGTASAIKVGNENIKKVYKTIFEQNGSKSGVKSATTYDQTAAPDWGNRRTDPVAQVTNKASRFVKPQLENPSLTGNAKNVQGWISNNPNKFKKIIGNK